MNKRATFLFVMDPPETLNLATETSLLLMQELIKRRHRVFWVQQEDIALYQDQPMGRVYEVCEAEPLRRAEPAWENLNRFDAVLVRKDPPFETVYLHLTLVLDHLDPRIAQFNDVAALRNFNEKILPLRWPDFSPPTLISMNATQIAAFAVEHRRIVLKPLHDCSGRGIRKIDCDTPGDVKLQIEEALRDANGLPRFLVAQKFLSQISLGDKRVYLVNGEPVGQVNRIPQQGSFLANIHQGANCEAATLNAREEHIIAKIGPFLREQGIFLAGADFIAGYLTELNITSPSAIRQINAVSGTKLQQRIVDAMLEHMGIIETSRPAAAADASQQIPQALRCCASPGCCVAQ
jgi:glutathione synthase